MNKYLQVITARPLSKVFLVLCALILSVNRTQAEAVPGQQDFQHYSVYHSVFNSTFILPKVAAANQIKRSKYESLLNISVSEKNQHGSIAVKISGTVTNLLQQQKSLKFTEIKEANAVYYIAPVRVANQEVLHFRVSVTPVGEDEALVSEFTKTVYAE